MCTLSAPILLVNHAEVLTVRYTQLDMGQLIRPFSRVTVTLGNGLIPELCVSFLFFCEQ